MARVFLSYKTQDRREVLYVKDFLAKSLISAWMDLTHLSGGQPIMGNVIKNIDESQYFVAFISYEYIRSKSCMIELKHAFDRKNYNGLFVIPVLLEENLDKLNLNGDDVQDRHIIRNLLSSLYVSYDNLRRDKGANEILKAISNEDGIIFSQIETRNIENTEIQIIKFDIQGGKLLPENLARLNLNIESDFIGDGKPLSASRAVALNGRGPNWLYAHLSIQFKNLCSLYIYNNITNGYVCVYDLSGKNLGTIIEE